MIVSLIGMPGCGKSCMGRAIAKRLGLRCVDGDRIIERHTGKRLQNIIDEQGLDEFLKIEEEVILSITDDNIMLSTGGSAVYSDKAMRYLKSRGPVVYLYCSLDVIKERLGDFSKRGVALRPGQTLESLYEERCVLYEKYADVTVDVSGKQYAKYQARVIAAIQYLCDN